VELNRLGLTPIVIFNIIVWAFFTFAFFYQFVYIIVVWRRGTVKLPEAKRQHRYAFFIAAHNEEPVIGNLVRSIKAQDYPADLIDTFVVADACNDRTAEEARAAGAIVYERNDLARKGKSWVLDYGFNRILDEYGDRYEAFIVFDADNLLAPNYVTIMNQAFDAGYLVCTSYRNSKNFDSSWVSRPPTRRGSCARRSISTTLVCCSIRAAPSRGPVGSSRPRSCEACTGGTSIP
jgi:cellulose synthase/poly-beta-1,6-N-acetylglucosamine synthase-like glycosyltransferase